MTRILKLPEQPHEKIGVCNRHIALAQHFPQIFHKNVVIFKFLTSNTFFHTLKKTPQKIKPVKKEILERMVVAGSFLKKSK